MSRIEQQLQELGLTLPSPKAPVANYVNARRVGELLYVSGRVSELRGIVGDGITLEQAKLAARDTALLQLSLVKQEIGSLDEVVAVIRMQGFVRSSATFTKQPAVIDGASDLLVALWGDAGRHARTATGTNALPFGAAVQLDLILRLR